MAATNVLRFIGPTTVIGISGTASTATTISPSGNNQMDYCAFLNPTANIVTINIVPVVGGVGTAGAATVASGTTNQIVLGVSMQTPMVIAVPPVFSISAIGTSGSLYVTPVGDQS
jgi:P pilus assembly chaperone PapD